MPVETTTTERILYYTGVNYKIGDTLAKVRLPWTGWLRSRREVSQLLPAATTCHWTLQEQCKPKPGALEHRINIIDTQDTLTLL